MKKAPLIVSLTSVVLLASPLNAAPLEEARLTRIHNQVKMIDPARGIRPAVVSDVVKGNVAVRTGAESGAELRFADQTLNRLGSRTLFSFKGGTRIMNLENGSFLFQIPKGVGGAEVNTAAITAAITGTTGLCELTGDHFKIIVLEGSVKVFKKSNPRETVNVRGGEMLTAPHGAKSATGWTSANVDVARIMETSTLVSERKYGALPVKAKKAIYAVAAQQAAPGQYVRTGLLASAARAAGEGRDRGGRNVGLLVRNTVDSIAYSHGSAVANRGAVRSAATNGRDQRERREAARASREKNISSNVVGNVGNALDGIKDTIKKVKGNNGNGKPKENGNDKTKPKNQVQAKKS